MPDPGIGTGVGGFFTSLLNPGLATRVAQHLTPNPSPLAQQGGPAVPGAVDGQGNPMPSPGSNLPPSAATQADPVNAPNVAKLSQPDPSYVADFMRYNRMNALSDDLNRNLEGVAAGFGTAQQQASKQAALGAGGGGVGDSLGALAKIQAMQDQTVQDNQKARFMGNAAVFAQTLSTQLGRPVSVAEATEIMNNPDTLKTFTTAAGANATTTGTQKDAEAATRAWADANPKATPQQIADYKANLIAGGMGGSDLGERQYLAERSSALAAGQGASFPDYPTWKAQHAAQADAMATQAKQSQEFKDTATQDYSANNSKLTKIQPYIDTLLSNPAAAQQAMATMFPTTGKGATWMPNAIVSPEEKAAAVALNTVRSTLSADALAGVKNVRNQREFSTLGQAAFGGLDPAASPENFQAALVALKNKFLDTQATNELAVGHKLTGNLVGHGNQDLLEPTLPSGAPNPYYNGGSQDNDFRKMKEQDAEDAINRLPSGARFVGPDGQPYTKK